MTTDNKLDLEVRNAGDTNTAVLQRVQSITGLDKCASGIQSACPGWRLATFKINTAILEATQRQQTYGAELDLIRNWNPSEEGWSHQRTLIQLIPNYDDKRKNNKPGAATITRDYDGQLQHLFFITSDRFYASTVVDLYHNNSLGLYLVQSYGGGLGTIWNGLELNADFRFIGEHFYGPNPSQGLIGSELSARYAFLLKFIRPGSRLSVTGIYVPVFNASRAWQTKPRLDLTIRKQVNVA